MRILFSPAVRTSASVWPHDHSPLRGSMLRHSGNMRADVTPASCNFGIHSPTLPIPLAEELMPHGDFSSPARAA